MAQTHSGQIDGPFRRSPAFGVGRIVRRWGTTSGAVRRMTGHLPPVIDASLAAIAIQHHTKRSRRAHERLGAVQSME
jgi:hypothetical protein